MSEKKRLQGTVWLQVWKWEREIQFSCDRKQEVRGQGLDYEHIKKTHISSVIKYLRWPQLETM